MKTLALTSPYTTGADVKAAQAALKGNVFNQDYLRGTVDGVFGEATARACVRAKYWLGYDLDDQKPIYGDLLHGYLTGKRLLPVRLKAARNARLAAATTPKPLGVKALEKLAPMVGSREDPANSNNHLISRWYGVKGPWCAMAVTYGMVFAGSTGFAKGARFAYVPFMVIAARAGQYGLQIVRRADVRPGDIVCYDWQKGDGKNPYSFDHTGLVRSRVDGNGVFKTREGNTSDDWSGSQSNGGGLFDRDDRDTDRATCVFLRAGR